MNVQGLVVETPEEFRVATAVYREQEIFQEEMRRIFAATWVYLCHESELPDRGDYKSTWIGRQPIVVVRDDEGALGAFMNYCPHRGAALCREEYGRVRNFVCPYHGWSFRTNGQLVAIPDRPRYPANFPMEDKGLIPVPRVESFGGLVFGSLNPQVPTLREHIGEAAKHIELWLGRCAGGRYKAGAPHRYAYNGNWKFQAENVLDGYHPGFVHGSAFRTFAKFDGTFGNRVLNGVRPIGATYGYPGGHGVLSAGTPLESGSLDKAEEQRYHAALTGMHGEEKAREVLTNRHTLIFPSVVVMDFNIRVIQPISYDRTEVYSYPVFIEGESKAVNFARLHDVQTRLGTAGIVGADDMDIFNGGQSALEAPCVDWITLSRGHGMEARSPSGELGGMFSDEIPQRAFWRQWQKMMAGEAR